MTTGRSEEKEHVKKSERSHCSEEEVGPKLADERTARVATRGREESGGPSRIKILEQEPRLLHLEVMVVQRAASTGAGHASQLRNK